MNDLERAHFMQHWQRFAAQRQGFPPDGLSQAHAALLAEGQRQLDEWTARDQLLRLRSLQSRYKHA